MRSCSLSVLVHKTTEQIASLNLGRLDDAGKRRSDGWFRRLQPERPMRTVSVVVRHVDPERLREVAAPEDQQPVQAVGYGNAFMQLVGTRAGDRRAGRVGGPGLAGGR